MKDFVKSIDACPMVLIVEDDVKLQQLLSNKISFIGFCTLCASTFGEAISFLNTNKNITIVICDKNIEGEKGDGLEFTRKAKEIDPSIIIIGMSGHCEAEAEFLNSGASYFFLKPFSIDDLCNLLKNFKKSINFNSF